MRSWKLTGIRHDKKELKQGAGQNDATYKIISCVKIILRV